MIFVDTNVFMYAVGREHQLREPARALLSQAVRERRALATSAEVLQELLHAYLPVGRVQTLDAALRLAVDVATVWPVEQQDVLDARGLRERRPALSARDLLHLAVCARNGARQVYTFDRSLADAFVA